MKQIFLHPPKQLKQFLHPVKKVNLYLCGPTVYDHVHIGNLRGTILFDLLIRLLKEQGYRFHYYQNITDIDDKLIEQAQKLNQPEKQLATHYFQEYCHILETLKVWSPHFIKVTEQMPAIITFIERLITNGYAYVRKSGVYFDTNKINYDHRIGSLFKTHLQNNAVMLDKKHPFDFVIWKKQTIGQKWPSPWGMGRPGWHTECAALIYQVFGQNLTIHGGGNDLTFPHHFNEQAQFSAVFPDKKLTQLWLRNGFVSWKQMKLSKSQDPAITFLAKNFLKNYSPNVLRLLFYFADYARDINLNDTLLQYYVDLDHKIHETLKRVQLQLFLRHHQTFAHLHQYNTSLWERLLACLCDNLNTPQAMNLFVQTWKHINHDLTNKPFGQVLLTTKTMLKFIALIGLQVHLPVFDDQVKTQLHLWQNYLKQKKYHQADICRTWLQKRGIL